MSYFVQASINKHPDFWPVDLQMSFTLVGQKEEMEAVEEELQAHRELVKILQRQIDIDHKDKLARWEELSFGIIWSH